MVVTEVGARPREFFVGLDLGQSQDYSAWAVAERIGYARPYAYQVRHLHRWPLGTGYPAIVGEVAGLLARAPLRGQATLAVDATGVGPPVVDMLKQAHLPGTLVPITITGGQEASRDGGGWHVPKRDLVSTVTVLLQSGRLKIAPALPEAPILTSELQGFSVKITTAANDVYGAWREGQHDDLVLAVALAVWYGERPSRRLVSF